MRALIGIALVSPAVELPTTVQEIFHSFHAVPLFAQGVAQWNGFPGTSGGFCLLPASG